MYPDGALYLNTQPQPLKASDFKITEDAEDREVMENYEDNYDKSACENEDVVINHEAEKQNYEDESKIFKDDEDYIDNNKDNSNDEEDWDDETISIDSAQTYSL